MQLSEYPFFMYYMEEDKGKKYKHASDFGYKDPFDHFLIGESGGFLMNIDPNKRFVNTELLRPAAIAYEKDGVYTKFAVDSMPNTNFRKQETLRRLVGFKAPCLMDTRTGEIEEDYISGEHYNFINYERILKLDTKTHRVEEGKVTGRKIRGFPRYIDCQ